MRKFLLLIALMLLSHHVLAKSPSCYSSHNGYCQYEGQVRTIYVNSSGLILLYFDVAIDPSDASVANVSISHGNAGAIRISDNPDFANFFYSTALAAQASKRPVTLQMRGSISGYLKMDRIWLKE
ncbi:hypothetical protein J8L86_12555 [Shewanella sp. MMG014]|uniref:hypothetical protein n=1 Tax=unclassified Shewanella TaxID=196818 RepID=UPI0006D67AE0|nr:MULTISPECIES: hypothetical protein [unclassified Shewanella]KPZ73123.1 hypothetical protein AN944_00271 [Shewanella sp. P1-14-1]MBQ4890683.1 hypothetical protein [Shewanella sp. MMG014]